MKFHKKFKRNMSSAFILRVTARLSYLIASMLLEDLLRNYVNPIQDDWDDYLDAVELLTTTFGISLWILHYLGLFMVAILGLLARLSCFLLPRHMTHVIT